MRLDGHYINRACGSRDKQFLGSAKALRSGLRASKTKATFTTDLIAAVFAEKTLKPLCGGSWRPGLASQPAPQVRQASCGVDYCCLGNGSTTTYARHIIGLDELRKVTERDAIMQSCINELFKRNANTTVEDLDLGDQQLRGGLMGPGC